MKEARLIISQALPVAEVGIDTEVSQRRCDFVHGSALPADMDCPATGIWIDREIEVRVLRRDFGQPHDIQGVSVSDSLPKPGYGISPIAVTCFLVSGDAPGIGAGLSFMPAVQPAFQFP